MKSYLLLIIVLSVISCATKSDVIKHSRKSNTKLMSVSDKIVKETIDAHGGSKYNNAHYAFTFRNKRYEFKNNGAEYEYKLSSIKDGINTLDILNNRGFSRTVDDSSVTLSEKDKTRFGNSINSVIYFATLPYKLSDKAVNTAYKGETQIKNESYDIIQISFDEEGGGTDHDDIFYYWIHKDSRQIDYLAYQYAVNKGGVRFRKAYNKRNVGGILFQDYINYKAEEGTPLDDLPSLWEKGELKKLSEILTEDIVEL